MLREFDSRGGYNYNKGGRQMIIVLAVMLLVMTVLLLWVLYCYNKLWDSIYQLNKTIKSNKTMSNSMLLKIQDKPMQMSSEDVAKYVKDYLDKIEI